MRYRWLFPLILVVTACIVTACRPRQDPQEQLRQIVAATLTAMPPTTPTLAPTTVFIPTATPFQLAGLFCEYQFCIGHPADMAFYDISAVNSNQATPSTYHTGLMAAYSGSLLLQLMWQYSPGTSDPSFLLDLILQDGVDTGVGAPQVTLVRDMNVVYTPITTAATSVLPFGAAAAWTCGDRVFAWKAYTGDEASAATLFNMALSRFICTR
jgi:hypothetical protein